MAELFSVLLGHQGRATFENLAAATDRRYSCFTELTFRRWFTRFFDWMEFNMACVGLRPGEYIDVVDCTFLPKSGRATYGLGKFWSSCAGKAQRGLEASVLACVNVVTKQCFALEATQTPPGITQREGLGYSRLSFYGTGRPARAALRLSAPADGADALGRRRLLRQEGGLRLVCQRRTPPDHPPAQ